MCMVQKSELSDEINEILGTELEFERMKKAELKLFLQLLEEGTLLDQQVKYIGKKYGQQKLDETVENWYPGKYAGKLM